MCHRKLQQVHKSCSMWNLVSWNSMLDGYAKCGDVNLMRQVFDVMSERNVMSLMDMSYTEALAVFSKMRWESANKANEVTMISVLCACSHLGSLEQGRSMHQYIVENELHLTLILQTSLIDMYAKYIWCSQRGNGLVHEVSNSARKMDVLIWNAIIGGLATHGLSKEALDLYSKRGETS